MDLYIAFAHNKMKQNGCHGLNAVSLVSGDKFFKKSANAIGRTIGSFVGLSDRHAETDVSSAFMGGFLVGRIGRTSM